MSNRDKKRVLLTGGSGFVGQRFFELNKKKYDLTLISLRERDVESIDFTRYDVIVHMAGIAHRMEKTDPQLYFDVNFELTQQLARRAAQFGLSHFIFLSTIKVFGDSKGKVLSEESDCNPMNDPYGESKLQAELYLNSLMSDEFKVAIVRSPLVYGSGVKGNLIKLLKLADNSWPLPFAEIHNCRTMVYRDNLIAMIDAIIECDQGGTFLSADSESISTSTLIQEIRSCLGRNDNLFKLPNSLISVLRRIWPDQIDRLFGSLEMDASGSFSNLEFKPPYSISHGIKEMTEWYKNK